MTKGHRIPWGHLAALHPLGCLLQFFPGHAPADLQGIGCMDTEEDPEDFCRLGTGLDLFQVVVFFLLSKAALQSAGPFLGDGICQLPAVFLVFAGPSLALEVGVDVIAGGELPVLVGGVDGIGPGQSGLDLGQALGLKYSILEAIALMEGPEA